MGAMLLVIMQLMVVANALLISGAADYYAQSPISYPVHSTRKGHGNLHYKVAPRGASSWHKMKRPSSISDAPSISNEPGKRRNHFSAVAPSVPSNKHHQARHQIIDSSPRCSAYPPHFHGPRGTLHSYRGHHFSSTPAPSPQMISDRSIGISNNLVEVFVYYFYSWVFVMSPIHPCVCVPSEEPAVSPAFAPSGLMKKVKAAPPLPILSLPPPPPDEDCPSMNCMAPMTYTPAGSPCSCVWPIQVELRLEVALYTFFPLVSELAKEIASSIMLDHGQVRIMGADSVSQQQLEKTTVLINLVPRALKFGESFALSVFKKFWHKEIPIKSSLFGDYDVLYVHYPGLPASPPSSPGTSISGSMPSSGNQSNRQTIKPLGVKVPKQAKHLAISRITIAVVVLSSFSALVLCAVIILLLKHKLHSPLSKDHHLPPPPAKSSASEGCDSMVKKSIPATASTSFHSNNMAYMGAAKIFSLNDIEIATSNFNSSRILGEGGFGIVYSGKLDDSQEVAVKVLKREDQHGTREFLAEVEMLSRLHHRNLVKLIGICTDERVRCLVYELIPNGSVESHLHGADKEKSPLDWGARMKIALGAARGLAYLHEDSNPRVIHRDFKSSNILLEHDFTPKLSDFGLAREAQDEGQRQVSTQVMGTFGYLAPEYAMTGHLLVKSDVYSYGVVLLELLTGRKPVDLSQPQGQENLVSWARPLLTSQEGLEVIADPLLKLSDEVLLDSLAKVAAIASMCVQPEASHRPFMGEVVQALKLVCSEFDETNDVIDRGSFRQMQEIPGLTVDMDIFGNSGEIFKDPPVSGPHQYSYGSDREAQLGLPGSSPVSRETGIKGDGFWDFSSHFSSGPLRIGKRRKFWQRLKSLSRGSMSEHDFSVKLWPESC
ncbi:hypothetical protein SAY87_017278 [Trapa incisa]|uniref:Protein kinase domain-containing protein n=1 Tax=Trapa incisa TaxID=236973 RepID=A0AAN7QW14_9MYRT|nr:hypothetical protein SAY87_017278 [Trapa incisa]